MTRSLSNMHAEELDWRWRGEETVAPSPAQPTTSDPCQRCHAKTRVIRFLGLHLRQARTRCRRLDATLAEVHDLTSPFH